MNPIRVCFLIDDLATAGTESQLIALIEKIDRRVVQPYLVLLRGDSVDSSRLDPKFCSVMRLKIRRLKDINTSLRAVGFSYWLWRNKIDVIQTYFPDSSYFGILAGWLAGVKHRLRIQNNQGHWITPVHRRLNKLLQVFTTMNLTNCRAASQVMVRQKFAANHKIRVLENGVDLDRFDAVGPPQFSRISIRCVSNLRKVKGIDVLVQAAKILTSKYPSLEFKVAGEGPERDFLTSLIKENKLESNFFLVGSRRNIPEFLSDSSLCVLPSLSEGMSNALLEYMAAGRPVVSTAVGAAEEMIQTNHDGILVPPGDVMALASAIDGLIQNPAKALAMGQRAKKRIEQYYSREQMIHRFENFYQQLMRSFPQAKRVSAH